MPEKRYRKGCGPSCLGCWVNNLKHGNKEAKAYLKKHPEIRGWIIEHKRSPTMSYSTKSKIKRLGDKKDELSKKRIDFARAGIHSEVSDLWSQEKEITKSIINLL